MIITCPNCNKQFKVDNSLIPDEGRDLQCGSCNYIWFFKIEEENNEILRLKDEIDSNNIKKKEVIFETKQQLEKTKTEINKKREKISENKKNTYYSSL